MNLVCRLLLEKIQEIQIEMDKKSEEFLDNDSDIYLKEGA